MNLHDQALELVNINDKEPTPSFLPTLHIIDLFICTQIQRDTAASASAIFLLAVCEFSGARELSFVLEPPPQVMDRSDSALVTSAGAGWALHT
jgi:hypothetical protein